MLIRALTPIYSEIMSSDTAVQVHLFPYKAKQKYNNSCQPSEESSTRAVRTVIINASPIYSY